MEPRSCGEQWATLKLGTACSKGPVPSEFQHEPLSTPSMPVTGVKAHMYAYTKIWGVGIWGVRIWGRRRVGRRGSTARERKREGCGMRQRRKIIAPLVRDTTHLGTPRHGKCVTERHQAVLRVCERGDLFSIPMPPAAKGPIHLLTTSALIRGSRIDPCALWEPKYAHDRLPTLSHHQVVQLPQTQAPSSSILLCE